MAAKGDASGLQDPGWDIGVAGSVDGEPALRDQALKDAFLAAHVAIERGPGEMAFPGELVHSEASIPVAAEQPFSGIENVGLDAVWSWSRALI
jgi:hypothetical protein